MKKVLVASLVAHAAVFALLARERPTVVQPAPVAIFDEITLETEKATESTPVPSPEPEPEATPPEAAVAVSTSRRAGGAPPVAAPAAPASSTGVEPIAGANTDWVVNLGPGVQAPGMPGRGQFGSNGTNPFLTAPPTASGPAAEGPPKKNDPVGNGLKAAFLAPDQVNGIAAPVSRALESETRTSLAPLRGNAVFRAVVDATGAVTALHIVDTSSDRAGWEDARQRALAALQQKKLNLRGANGALIDIHVESEMRLPSGQVGGPDVGVKDGRLTLTGDLSDMGSKATRTVRARVSNYTPL